MKSIYILRRETRRVALQGSGDNPRKSVSFAWHRNIKGLDNVLLGLPFRAGTNGEFGSDNPDPTQHPVTGQAFFMVGVSEVGGDDPLAVG